MAGKWRHCVEMKTKNGSVRPRMVPVEAKGRIAISCVGAVSALNPDYPTRRLEVQAIFKRFGLQFFNQAVQIP